MKNQVRDVRAAKPSATQRLGASHRLSHPLRWSRLHPVSIRGAPPRHWRRQTCRVDRVPLAASSLIVRIALGDDAGALLGSVALAFPALQIGWDRAIYVNNPSPVSAHAGADLQALVVGSGTLEIAASGPPGTGSWSTGDIVFADNPAATPLTVGQVCVSSGTPGIWRRMT